MSNFDEFLVDQNFSYFAFFAFAHSPWNQWGVAYTLAICLAKIGLHKKRIITLPEIITNRTITQALYNQSKLYREWHL